MQYFETNSEKKTNKNISWRDFAEFMYFGKIYE
jgi:hypothetical protein